MNVKDNCNNNNNCNNKLVYCFTSTQSTIISYTCLYTLTNNG